MATSVASTNTFSPTNYFLNPVVPPHLTTESKKEREAQANPAKSTQGLKSQVDQPSAQQNLADRITGINQPQTNAKTPNKSLFHRSIVAIVDFGKLLAGLAASVIHVIGKTLHLMVIKPVAIGLTKLGILKTHSDALKEIAEAGKVSRLQEKNSDQKVKLQLHELAGDLLNGEITKEKFDGLVRQHHPDAFCEPAFLAKNDSPTLPGLIVKKNVFLSELKAAFDPDNAKTLQLKHHLKPLERRTGYEPEYTLHGIHVAGETRDGMKDGKSIHVDAKLYSEDSAQLKTPEYYDDHEASSLEQLSERRKSDRDVIRLQGKLEADKAVIEQFNKHQANRATLAKELEGAELKVDQLTRKRSEIFTQLQQIDPDFTYFDAEKIASNEVIREEMQQRRKGIEKFLKGYYERLQKVTSEEIRATALKELKESDQLKEEQKLQVFGELFRAQDELTAVNTEYQRLIGLYEELMEEALMVEANSQLKNWHFKSQPLNSFNTEFEKLQQSWKADIGIHVYNPNKHKEAIKQSWTFPTIEQHVTGIPKQGHEYAKGRLAPESDALKQEKHLVEGLDSKAEETTRRMVPILHSYNSKENLGIGDQQTSAIKQPVRSGFSYEFDHKTGRLAVDKDGKLINRPVTTIWYSKTNRDKDLSDLRQCKLSQERLENQRIPSVQKRIEHFQSLPESTHQQEKLEAFNKELTGYQKQLNDAKALEAELMAHIKLQPYSHLKPFVVKDDNQG